MVRKISFLVISIGIISIGYIAFRNLSYWERSTRIFKYDPGMVFERRGGHYGSEGRGNFRGREGFLQPGVSGREFERPQLGELPDSLRSIFQERRERFETRRSNVADTLRRGSEGNRLEWRGNYGEIRDRERRRRGGFPSGRNINLRNVYWFLAVFASFTVLVIYIDKAILLIKKKSSTKPCMNLK